MQVAIDYVEQCPLKGLRVLVVGLGVTGLSCARYLSLQGAEVVVADSRECPPGLEELRRELPGVELCMGGFNPAVFESAQSIVVSPGVSLDEPLLVDARRRGVEIVGDIELFARRVQAPVFAITGSNGKSTVTTLLGSMADAAGRDVRVGGNLGTPALDLIGDHEPDLYVLELSSFQLETVTSLRCQAAVVLNISADHLDRYDSLQAYVRAKQRIYAGAAVQVVNLDDMVAAGLATGSGQRVGFSLGLPVGNGFGIRESAQTAWIARGQDCWLPVGEVRMAGRHNLANALAALALGDVSGLSRDAMVQVLREFRGLPHRTEWVAEKRELRWFNDSKATNVGAALAAIQGFDVPLVVIAGGQGKGADFTELAAGLGPRVRGMVLLGEAAGEIEQAVQDLVSVEHARDMKDAVHRAAAMAETGDVVLLSPACASFDMFSGYAARGEAFRQAVMELDG
jgi:UDP-N-acetylmuramoylalanine--D-glutamate ligase